MIAGIIAGALAGFSPVCFPEPFDRLAIFVSAFALVGLALPVTTLIAHLVELKHTRLLIQVSLVGCGIGSAVGVIMAFSDMPLDDKMILMSVNFWLIAGAVTTELLLKKAEENYRKLLEEEGYDRSI